MNSTIVSVALGAFLVELGIMNMRGNISSIRLHCRNRVAKEDKVPFGKMVGMGRIITGISIAASEVLPHLAELFEVEILASIDHVMVIGGIAGGLLLCLYAVFKYNKGIF